MQSRIETLLNALINGETITGFKPQSRAEECLLAAVNKSGTEGLPDPQSRLDALLYLLADMMPESYGSDFEAGKQAERSDFWDDFQDNGKRTSYMHAFRSWTDRMFKPKYNITLTGDASGMFHGATISNLKQRLQDCGIVLDTYGATTMNALFQNSRITHLPTIDTRSCGSFSYTFYNMIVLKEFEKLILKEDGSQKVTASPFGNLHNLEKIVIEGKFGASITFAQSLKLTVNSAKNIIDALKNYVGTDDEGKHSLKLHEDVWNALEASGASPNGNTWKEYVTDLGWLY